MTHLSQQKANECPRGGKRGLTDKRNKGIQGVDGSVTSLDCGDGYTATHICQNSSNYPLKICEFYV